MTNLEKQIEHCLKLIENKGACSRMFCNHCPGNKEETGCWSPSEGCALESAIVVRKAKEFLNAQKEM